MRCQGLCLPMGIHVVAIVLAFLQDSQRLEKIHVLRQGVLARTLGGDALTVGGGKRWQGKIGGRSIGDVALCDCL